MCPLWRQDAHSQLPPPPPDQALPVRTRHLRPRGSQRTGAAPRSELGSRHRSGRTCMLLAAGREGRRLHAGSGISPSKVRTPGGPPLDWSWLQLAQFSGCHRQISADGRKTEKSWQLVDAWISNNSHFSARESRRRPLMWWSSRVFSQPEKKDGLLRPEKSPYRLIMGDEDPNNTKSKGKTSVSSHRL